MNKDYSETRQANGTFGKHNPGGPGRPRREMIALYLDAAIEECSIEDWKKIVRAQIAFAQAGNPQSATWVSQNITLGKPQEHIAITAEEPDRYVLELPRGSEDESDELPALESGDTE